MKYEKSCGAVVSRCGANGTEFLLVLNKKGNAPGHWGFPKGHMEQGENEYTAAAREIFEETGLLVVFQGGSRAVSTYSPRDGITKDSVYFPALLRDNQTVVIQKSEIAQYRWCRYNEALNLLTFDKDILTKLVK